MKRDASIELYRIALMFGVVLLHTHWHSVEHREWFGRLLTVSVVGFVFISGYFGIRFTVGKLLKLYLTAVFDMCVVMLVVALGTNQIHGILQYATEVFDKLKACWFLHAYAVLMLFAPMLNAALEKKGWEVPFLFVAFGWSYMWDIISFKPYIFPVSGFGSYSPLTLCGIYVAARLFKLSGIENRILLRHVLAALPILVFLGAIGLNHYNSPPAFLLAMALFLLFKRGGQVFAEHCKSLILIVSPCMFGVYVMHCADQSEAFVSWIGAKMISNGCNVFLSYFISAGLIFIGCIIVELIRRYMLVRGESAMCRFLTERMMQRKGM